jgi:MGT family glycosyltransferase
VTPTIVFFPEGAYGPTNNCVAIGESLRDRGARVVFVVEESFAGTLEARGFEERRMRLGPPPEVEEAPGQFWKDYIRDTAPVFRRPTIEQLAGFIEPTWRALCDGARYVEPRLREIFDELQPDVVVEDNVVGFAAVVNGPWRWVRIVSCNPAEVPDELVPPAFSGLPEDDRSGWDGFRAEYRRVHADLLGDFGEWMREQGAPPLPDGQFIHESPDLDLYLYPRELDYQRANPLDPPWHRMESSVRTSDAAYELPEELATGDGRLLYLSLGSLGSADVELMQRLVDMLAATPHRVIVSKGPQHDQLTLGSRMTGAEFLPQPSVLPQVDCVITHGGNNTVTECVNFGRPMVVLPLFWDQYDNAQRVDEIGLGVRLDTYRVEPEQLTGAIDRLCGDAKVASRLAAASRRLQDEPGHARAAERIEALTKLPA